MNDSVPSYTVVLALGVVAALLKFTLGWPLSPVMVACGLFVLLKSRRATT